MATQFKLAAMGHTMETGRVVEWHISEGESIDEGQLLISIETDKTVVDVNSPVSGVLLKTVGQVDAEYDVGDVLAWIGDAGETVPDQPVEPDPKKQSVSAGPRVTPVAQRLADRHGINADAVQGTGPDGRVTKKTSSVRLMMEPPRLRRRTHRYPQVRSCLSAGSGGLRPNA